MKRGDKERKKRVIREKDTARKKRRKERRDR